MREESHGDRLLLRSNDVLLEQDAIEFCLIDLQMGRTAVLRLQAAQRIADLVDARLRQRILQQRIAEHVPRPDLEADFIEQSQLPQPFAMPLADLTLPDRALGAPEGR